jgi:uncharacterized protein (DUF849 family)
MSAMGEALGAAVEFFQSPIALPPDDRSRVDCDVEPRERRAKIAEGGAMRDKKLIIEVRINEYEMREANPHVPWTAREIGSDAAACRDAGASIVHFHARTPDGAAAFGHDAYRAVIAEIRGQSDILIHSTLGGPDRIASAEDRMAHIIRLAEAGFRPDFAPLDMGTTNTDPFDPATEEFRSDENTYVNTTRTLRYFAETLRRLGIKPNMQIWNIPMMRWATAFHSAGLVTPPLLLNLTLSDGGFIATHPGNLKGLRAYLDFLPAGVPCEWTVTLGGANILPLAAAIIARGGHIAIGLGDYHFSELGQPDNAELVGRLAAIAGEVGRELATPAETKAMLALA